MSAYKPFPISDFDVGMYQAKEPWLSPTSAWRNIENGHVFRGRLKSRPGFQTFGGLGTAVVDQVHPVVPGPPGDVPQPGWKYYSNATSPNAPVIAPYKTGDTSTYRFQLSVYVDSAEEIFYDTGEKIRNFPVQGIDAYRLSREGDADEFNDSVYHGFIIRETGAFFFFIRDAESITDHPGATAAPPYQYLSTYDYLDGDPCMGISTFTDDSASEVTLAASTTAIFRWNTSEQRFQKLSVGGGVTLSGTDSDYFWFEAFGPDAFICNGLNKPLKYDPSASPPIVLAGTDWSGGGDLIYSAKACIRYKGRLLYFAIDDDNTGVKQGRVRWTQIGNPEGWDRSTDYLDAPTNDAFVTARLLGDRILVGFTREWWELAATGDPLDPFRWLRIPSEEGAVSLNCGVSFSEYVLFRSDVSISGIDGMGQSPVDDAIPDLTVGWNPNAAEYTCATRYDQLRQVWWSYADRSEDKPGHILVMQIEPGGGRSWSVWTLSGVHCFGDTRNSSNLLWDDVYETWDEVDWSWDSPAISAGFPQVLVGKRDGSVWIVTSDADDDGDSIPFLATSQRLSPYPGLRTRFGYVDVMADAVTDGMVTLRFRRDFETADLLSETVSLTPESGSEQKVIRRVPINIDATFLTMTVEQDGVTGTSLDMFEFWAKPSGLMRWIG